MYLPGLCNRERADIPLGFKWPRLFHHGCWEDESQQVQAETRQGKSRCKEELFLCKDSQAAAEIAQRRRCSPPLLEVLKTCLRTSICISSNVF